MEKKAFPTFNGKPLIEIPAVVPTANFLVGEFGEAVLNRYNEVVEQRYDGNKALKVLEFRDNPVIGSNPRPALVMGSNPYAVVVMNQVLQEYGLHVPTPAELEQILKVGALDLEKQLSHHYEESALVLRTNEEPNGYLARNLSEQLKEKRRPVMVPLNGLYLKQDANAPHGLVFKLNDGAQEIYAPQLSGEHNGKSFSETDKNGLPVSDENGERTNNTIKTGLSGLVFEIIKGGSNLGSNLYSCGNWGALDESGLRGRILAVGQSRKR